MLKKSRPIIGNTQRLHAYLRKLHSQQCTVVVFLGGSVTEGHGVEGGQTNAYPEQFTKWLNERYPCYDEGVRGEHVMKRTLGRNSQILFIHWGLVRELERIDLVFVEFNVNDSYILDTSIPHALEEKADASTMNLYAPLWYNEVLLRRLLLLRKPDPLAIITFNADYAGTPWAPPPQGNPKEDRKSIFRLNNEPLKLWISSLYEIPVFSANVWMLPIASKRGMGLQFNKTYEYSTARWHVNQNVHPHKGGHRILTLIMAYCFVKEEEEMTKDVELLDIERDFTLHGVLRDPVYLSPDEESSYVLDDVDIAFSIDFTDPEGQSQWKDHIVVNDGPWEWYADNADKDKYGLITNDVKGGPHISIAIVGGKLGLVEISFVTSYENFGISLAWVDEFQNNMLSSMCKIKVIRPGGKATVNGPQMLVATWEEKASVPRVQVLKMNLKEGQKRFLHICLTPKNPWGQGTENKFKLLGFRSY